MPTLVRCLVLGLGFWLFQCPAPAQSTGVASEPFGYSTIALAADSETFVSVPFERPAAFTGQVSVISGNVLTADGAPNWTTGQFAYSAGTQPSTYYVFFRTGAKEGHSFIVTTNTTDSLTLELGNNSLAGVLAGDGIRIVPCWTLGTLFPATGAGLAFAATIDPVSPATTILLTDSAAVGINPTPAAYYFYSGAWRQIGQSVSVSKNDQLIRPGMPFRVRNGINGGVFVAAGAVVMEKHALLLGTRSASAQDNEVALMRPVPVSLIDSGLASSGAFSSSPDALGRTDVLMVFDNAETRLNKPASDYFIYYNGGWRKLGQPLNQDFGTETVFGPARGVVIRKAATTDGAPQTWVNRPQY